ncbi:MAG: FtsQ-type POTRA domain-containing protein [Nitrospirae bacterium]|nr:MAG: FtsQ-type POTRA domain-containing protein [Nitrospirota bacterium]
MISVRTMRNRLGVHPLWRRKWKRSPPYVLSQRILWIVLLVIGGVGIPMGYQQVQSAFAAWTRLEQITVFGLERVSRRDLLTVMKIPSETTLWTLDPPSIARRVLAHPWIASASVARVWPHTLTITVVERRPAAILRHGTREWVIARDGVVLADHRKPSFGDLPILVGPPPSIMPDSQPTDVPERLQRALRLASLLFEAYGARPVVDLDEPAQFRAAVRALEFRFTDNFEPEWARYRRLLSLGHVTQETDPCEIDLRFPGKVIIREKG